MSKVLIVTDEEIASYALAHQQILLDKLTALAQEYPDASKEELFEYARRELTINPAQISLPSHKSLKELPALTAPPRKEEQPTLEQPVTVEPPVEETQPSAEESTHTEWVEDEDDNNYSPQEDYDSPASAPEETLETVPAEDDYSNVAVEPVTALPVDDIDALQEAYNQAVKIQPQLPVNNSPASTPAQEEPWTAPEEDFVPPPIEENNANIAFRQKRYKGLFQEASRLDK